MSWFRLDDQGAFHEKVVQAGNEAYGAWCRAGQWASGRRTEGLIPRATALTIAPMRVWQKLVAAKGRSAHGLVEPVGDDFQIHDYLDWNPTADAVDAKREARSVSGRLGGIRSGETRRAKQTPKQAGSKVEANASANGKQNRTPSPSPSPSPVPEDPRSQTGVVPGEPMLVSGPVVEIGSARCEACCEAFVATLAEAGWPRPDLRERWERQSLCDGINAHLRADGSAAGVLAELRRAVREWVDAYRESPQFTSGWGARKFSEWLTSGRVRTSRLAAPQRPVPADSGTRAAWIPEPPSDAGKAYTPEELAAIDAELEATISGLSTAHTTNYNREALAEDREVPGDPRIPKRLGAAGGSGA